jgi:membrane-anchored glycerophosphoryl diester phosphodiesterase (GDPDase)
LFYFLVSKKEEVPTMQYNLGFNESGGLLRYIMFVVLTAIAGLFLYLLLFVLTSIGIYFIKKNQLEEVVPQHDCSNVIYLNAASKQWHKNRRII